MPAPSPARPTRPRAPRLAALLLLVLAAACSDATAPADPLASPGELTVGALQVRAATGIVGAPTSNGPAVLRTTVTLTNRGAWPLVLRLSACPLRVDGHRLAARSDAPAFSYPGLPPFTNTGPCILSLVEVTIAPGATHDLVAAVDVAALRAAVAPGRWFLRAAVHIDVAPDAVLLVPAGDVTL